MSSILPYRLLSYFLLPLALFLGLIATIALLFSLANPQVLILVFLFGAVLIYTFCSLRFLHQGILQRRALPPSLKDWIKVNAYVSLVLGMIFMINSYMLLINPQLLDQAMRQQPGKLPMEFGTYMKSVKVVLYCFMLYGLFLLTHVVTTLVLVRRYAALFGTAAEGGEE
jgi:hypothetical protein